MRIFEIAHRPHRTARYKWSSTVTLFVQEHEWDILRFILSNMGPTEMTAMRPLCRFDGISVDILCQSPEAASDLIGKFYNRTAKKPEPSAAVDESRRTPTQR